MSDPPAIACIPMKVDAFVLNDLVAGDPNNPENVPKVKVAPITQPNYTFLRLNNDTIQSDVLPHTDLHYTSPADHNSRLTDLGTGERRLNRLGVYISWTLPRAYRMGAAGTNTASSSEQRLQDGYQPIDPEGSPDFSAPDFRPVPTRWLVVRCVDKQDLVTPTEVPPAEMDKILYKAWVIESDLLRQLDDIDINTDLQTDVSPFVITSRKNGKNEVEQQAEIFIGSKFDATQWEEEPENPRVALSILNASNHLFADFQPHNSNVFSMVDDFSYLDANQQPQKISKATASYYVIGWHSNEKENLYYISPDGPTTLGQRMSTLAMALKNSNIGAGVQDWPSSKTSTNLLCHGAMYNVAWNYDTLPSDPAAAEAAELLERTQPIAVGTTPTDALLAYIHAHVGEDTGTVKELEQDIIKIETLLLAQDDGVDVNLQAADQLEDKAYERFDGGLAWHLQGTSSGSGQHVQPTPDQQSKLTTLNLTQQAYDNTARTVQKLQWDMFSIWWKYVSGAYTANHTPDKDVQQMVKQLVAQVNLLQDAMNKTFQPTITSLSAELQAQKGSNLAFAQRKDPTLLVGGVQAGWPHDYLDNLLIRIDSQIIAPTEQTPLDPTWLDLSSFAKTITKNLPPELKDPAIKLLQEFSILHPTDTTPPDTDVTPLYHDQLDDPARKQWRDRWNGQPWSPLFVEWEAQYFHVPYEDFSLEPRSDGSKPVAVLRWGIKDGIDLSSPTINDMRTISGRILILPQPSFSLANAVGQLITNMGTKFPLPDEVQFLKNPNNYYQLPYLSSTMGGLTSHLTTRILGTHIKPNQRPRGEILTPMAAAVDAGKNAGIDGNVLQLIGTETGVTPYGSSVQIPDKDDPVFKPATHGQLRFTQINVIDKFGRAICALDPIPRPISKGYPHIAPCMAELFSCQPLSTDHDTPNTVRHDLKPPACEFVQLPPAINQPSRINAYYVLPDTNNNPFWRPVSDWETPIYGWLVVNYADYGLQFFLQDGTFYRELRLGGPQGLITTPAWVPFPPSSAKEPTQLDDLINAISALPAAGETSYLQAFFNMINLAFGSIPPAPNSYAQFVNSIVGKPLALVNFGISLELATEPLDNESNFQFGTQPYTLLPPGKQRTDSPDPSSSSSQPSRPTGPPPKQTQYTFPVQIGDESRTYDGLIGYWPQSSTHSGTSIEFDFNSVYTYWPTEKCPHTTTIAPINYPQLAPFWVPPYTSPPPGEDPKPQTPIAVDNARNSCMQLFSAVVDPFSPVHLFTGTTLPTVPLTLPHWTTEAAMTKMTAFFHMGPVLLTQDVPQYKPSAVAATTGSDPPPPPPDPTAGKVGLPALATGQWQWLQPYKPATGTDQADGAGGGGDVQPQYQALPLLTVDGRPRFEKAPYTAVEGFLQLSQPIASTGQKASS